MKPKWVVITEDISCYLEENSTLFFTDLADAVAVFNQEKLNERNRNVCLCRIEKFFEYERPTTNPGADMSDEQIREAIGL